MPHHLHCSPFPGIYSSKVVLLFSNLFPNWTYFFSPIALSTVPICLMMPMPYLPIWPISLLIAETAVSSLQPISCFYHSDNKLAIEDDTAESITAQQSSLLTLSWHFSYITFCLFLWLMNRVRINSLEWMETFSTHHSLIILRFLPCLPSTCPQQFYIIL